MKRTILQNGYIWLQGLFEDTRTKNIHDDVVCKPEHEKFFVEVVEEAETTEQGEE